MKNNRKGFTILELLVVVAIIAILAVIAVPQFMGAIEKSRVSAQIADLNAVNKAATMYNFDNSKFPANAAAMTPTDGSTVYINAFPAANKWNGNFVYEKVASDDATTGLKANQYVVKMSAVPTAQATQIDMSIDQKVAAAAVADDPATAGVDESKPAVEPAKEGLVRLGTAASGVQDVYYVIGQ